MQNANTKISIKPTLQDAPKVSCSLAQQSAVNFDELLEKLETEIRNNFSSAPSVLGDLLSEIYSLSTHQAYREAIVDCKNPEISIRIWLKKRLVVSLMCVRIEVNSLSSEWSEGLGE